MPSPPVYNVDEMFAVWHLYAGGIRSPASISRLLGRHIHANTIKRVVAKAEEVIYGPITLTEPVRCVECGGKITQVPCRSCGSPLLLAQGYRECSNPEEGMVQ